MLQHRLSPTSLAALAAALFLLSALYFALTVMRPLQLRVGDLEALAAAQQLSARDQTLPVPGRSQVKATPTQTLLASLPDEGQHLREYGHMLEIARANNVQIERADYATTALGAGIIQHRIRLPARGRYADVRNFIGKMLNSSPYLALESLRIERPRVAEAVIEAELEWGLYLKSAP